MQVKYSSGHAARYWLNNAPKKGGGCSMFGYYAEFIVFLHFILLFFFLHYFATLAIWYWIAIKCLVLCLSTTMDMVVVEGRISMVACLPALTIVRRHHLCNHHRCYRCEQVEKSSTPSMNSNYNTPKGWTGHLILATVHMTCSKN